MTKRRKGGIEGGKGSEEEERKGSAHLRTQRKGRKERKREGEEQERDLEGTRRKPEEGRKEKRRFLPHPPLPPSSSVCAGPPKPVCLLT